MEICINSEWGTMCDRVWGDVNAGVVCQQLGYASDGEEFMS